MSPTIKESPPQTSLERSQITSQRDLLWAKVQYNTNLTEQEKRWYRDEMFPSGEALDMGGWKAIEEKVLFYLWAAQVRQEIVSMAPLEHQTQVLGSINRLLDKRHSGSFRQREKGQPLQEMRKALEAFGKVQKMIQGEARSLGFLPHGFEARIWGRFQTMYLAQGRDIINIDEVKAFEASIKKTLGHLAKIGEQQEKFREKLEKEKYFQTKDKQSGKRMREVVAAQFESQMYHWLDNALKLRDWSKKFTDLLDKQMPEKLKAFNKTYHQVYGSGFWELQGTFSPQEFPAFTAAFNFHRESDFLHEMSLDDIKKKTKKVHESLGKDGEELLLHFFSPKERKQWQQKIKAIKSPRLVALMKLTKQIKGARENHEQEAKKEAVALQAFERRRFILEAHEALEEMRKHFGPEVLSEMRLTSLQRDIEKKKARIDQLKKELKKAKSVEAKEEIQTQLIDLDATFYFPDNGPGAREHKIKQLKEQFEMYLSAKRFSSARKIAVKLKKYDAIAAYELEKRLQQEQDKFENRGQKDTDTGEEKEEKVVDSNEKIVKMRFFERCVEHAEKVKEACGEIGIPTDDANFWGQDGIRNRVQWLKDKGLYSAYLKYHASDKNVPKTEGNQGFRFRWLDGRGTGHLSLAKAEDGCKYLDRYKESGYHLCALAGAFSLNWKSSADRTYTPDDFITKVRAEMASL